MYFMKSTADKNTCCTYTCKSKYYCVVLFSCALTLLLTGVSFGEVQPTTPEIATQNQEKFEYLIENRKDPFLPFITEKATTSDIDMNEIVDNETNLSGMQLFEPGQLNLVALMKRGQEDFAMVEDFTGKGYVISEGTKIGKRGVVKEIIPNKVIIEETAETRAGQKIVTNTVMVLKKEGEE